MLCLSTLFIAFIKRVLKLDRGVFFCGSHKGETTTRDGHIKGTGVREGNGCGGSPRKRSVRFPKGSLPAGGGHVRCSQQIVLPWDKVDRVWPRGCPVLNQGALSSGGRAAALQAAGHRFESDRVHATSSRALHKTPVRSRRRDSFGWGEKNMLTRQEKRRVLEALDERLLMEMLLNPVDALCDTWDYGHY